MLARIMLEAIWVETNCLAVNLKGTFASDFQEGVYQELSDLEVSPEIF